MKRVTVMLLAAASLAGTAFAGNEASVYCGSVRCMTLHAEAHGQTAEQRAEWAMELLNKYLGGKVARLRIAHLGADTQILLNGEVLLAVTPEDARAEKFRSASTLAERWKGS